MNRKTPKDIAASVRQRLLDLSRKRGEDFGLVLVRYATERLLYRLGQSPHADRFFPPLTTQPQRFVNDFAWDGY